MTTKTKEFSKSPFYLFFPSPFASYQRQLNLSLLDFSSTFRIKFSSFQGRLESSQMSKYAFYRTPRRFVAFAKDEGNFFNAKSMSMFFANKSLVRVRSALEWDLISSPVVFFFPSMKYYHARDALFFTTSWLITSIKSCPFWKIITSI